MSCFYLIYATRIYATNTANSAARPTIDLSFIIFFCWSIDTALPFVRVSAFLRPPPLLFHMCFLAKMVVMMIVALPLAFGRRNLSPSNYRTR